MAAQKSHSLDPEDQALIVEALAEFHSSLDAAYEEVTTIRAAAASIDRQRQRVERLRTDVRAAKRIVVVTEPGERVSEQLMAAEAAAQEA